MPGAIEQLFIQVFILRPAEVTLDCVWPTDKATRQPVTNPERLVNMRWSQKIEQITIKMGARFLEYRPDTGSWVFEVRWDRILLM